jgi:hypothetical protein
VNHPQSGVRPDRRENQYHIDPLIPTCHYLSCPDTSSKDNIKARRVLRQVAPDRKVLSFHAVSIKIQVGLPRVKMAHGQDGIGKEHHIPLEKIRCQDDIENSISSGRGWEEFLP